MRQRSTAQTIESFHLLFLQALVARGGDDFVLKGGANLRYFCQSVRYSNDIDFDFVGRNGDSLAVAVEKVVTGRPLGLLLSAAGIELSQISRPKQTDTTRRWRLGIRRSDLKIGGAVIPTKIEFSARMPGDDDVLVDRVPDSIVVPYGQIAPTLRHYGETAAANQKMWALADRTETKTRDVFDLDLLFRRRFAAGPTVSGLSAEHAAQAAEKAMELKYSSYESEVVPFLDPDAAAVYGTEEVWEQMRESVVRHLLEIGSAK